MISGIVGIMDLAAAQRGNNTIMNILLINKIDKAKYACNASCNVMHGLCLHIGCRLGRM